MLKIIFVGDQRPKNADTSSGYVPFVTAKCFERLISWVKVILPDYYILINSSTFEDQMMLVQYKELGFKFIALGNKASKVLKKLDIEHLKIDHPSGLNRKLNDPEYVKEMLSKAYFYIREKDNV